MRRRRVGWLALAAVVPAVAACDTDDGREMQPPDSYAVYQLQNTSPSTTSTVAPPPSEFIPATTSSTSTSSTTSSVPGSAPASDGSAPAGAWALTAPWADGAAIPVDYTCDGAGAAPALSWTAPPDGTVEVAVSVVDPDANGYVHWSVIGLPPAAGALGGGAPLPAGANEGLNGSGAVGWTPPCPPADDGPHRYVFTVHALDQATELPADSPTDALLTAIDAATASSAAMSGTYERA